MLPILENGSWTYRRIKEKKGKTRTETASCVRGLAAGAQGCTLQGTTGPLMDTRGGCFRNDCSKLTTRLWPELQDLVPSRLVVVPL